MELRRRLVIGTSKVKGMRADDAITGNEKKHPAKKRKGVCPVPAGPRPEEEASRGEGGGTRTLANMVSL